MYQLELIEFIKNHPDDWEKILKNQPYGLIIKHKNGLVIFNYTLFNSDFSIPLTREARGIILEEGTWEPVCHAFNKFFNFQEEGRADTIDWNTAKVQTKVDGSIIKLYRYNDSWKVATNSMIDAFEVTTVSPKIEEATETHTFGDLFIQAAKNQHLDFDKLGKNKTYIFELTSVYNEQVIHYDGVQIWHLGTRNMVTGLEEDIDIGIQKPKEWPLHTLSDCSKIANAFTDEQEGFVVVDANRHRIKVKSPYYVATSHQLNDNLSLGQLVKIFLSGDYEEFIGLFPKYKDVMKKLETHVEEHCKRLEYNCNMLCSLTSLTRQQIYYQALAYEQNDVAYIMKKYSGKTINNDGTPYTAKNYYLHKNGIFTELKDFLRKGVKTFDI